MGPRTVDCRAPATVCAALLALTAFGGGCAAPPAAPPPAARAPVRERVCEGLVHSYGLMPAGASASSGWEADRNDAALGIGPRAPTIGTRLVLVSGYDRRATINGRVIESSYTRTRTLEAGSLPPR